MRTLTCISVEEQKKLSQGIEQSLGVKESLESMIVKVPTDPAAKAMLLQRDWSQAPVKAKLNHWAKNLLSVKTESEFLLETKLSLLRDAIKKYPKSYVDFSRRALLPSLAESIYEVYRSLYPLQEPIKRLFSDLELLQKLLRHFIERKLPNPKSSLMELISVEEMKQIFFKTESKPELLEEINKRLKQYLASIDPEVMKQILREVLPLYGFRNLAIFPFTEIFDCFKGKLAPDRIPEFEEALVFPTIDYLENLFCILYPFHTYTPQKVLPMEVLEYLSGTILGSEESPHSPAANPSRMETATHLINKLVENCQRLLKEVPFVEIIRYYKADPYYRVMIYHPKVQIQQFYAFSLTLKVYHDFDAFFAKVRFDILEDLMNQLFRGEPLAEFQYYMNPHLNLIPKEGYPGFTHHRSLVLLYTFLRRIYKGYIQETIHILNRTVTTRVRDTISQVLIHASGLEETEARLVRFDNSFAPDSEGGKIISVLKVVIDRDPKQQKIYRSFIAEKDREGKEILAKALGHMESLLNGFQNIARDKVFLKETARRFPLIESRVSSGLNYLLYGTKALRYLMAMEKGAI